MVATIDLGSVQSVQNITMHFLDDPRHWIFIPEEVKIEVSADGSKYETVSDTKDSRDEEHFDLQIKKISAAFEVPSARYIMVTASNSSALPQWRFKEGKKPMIACDEVYVQ